MEDSASSRSVFQQDLGRCPLAEAFGTELAASADAVARAFEHMRFGPKVILVPFLRLAVLAEFRCLTPARTIRLFEYHPLVGAVLAGAGVCRAGFRHSNLARLAGRAGHFH